MAPEYGSRTRRAGSARGGSTGSGTLAHLHNICITSRRHFNVLSCTQRQTASAAQRPDLHTRLALTRRPSAWTVLRRTWSTPGQGADRIRRYLTVLVLPPTCMLTSEDAGRSGERAFFDTEEVRGSNPLAPTRKYFARNTLGKNGHRSHGSDSPTFAGLTGPDPETDARVLMRASSRVTAAPR